jgi:hypothetical protein
MYRVRRVNPEPGHPVTFEVVELGIRAQWIPPHGLEVVRACVADALQVPPASFDLLPTSDLVE